MILFVFTNTSLALNKRSLWSARDANLDLDTKHTRQLQGNLDLIRSTLKNLSGSGASGAGAPDAPDLTF